MLVEATRESGSKETVSNEKDWSLKHFLFLSSSSALLPFHSPVFLVVSPPGSVFFFFCLGRSYFERNRSTVMFMYIWK